MPRIIVTAKKGGGMTIKTEGFRGPECLNKSKWLEEALGTTIKIEETAEFYEAPVEVIMDQEVNS